MQCRTIPYEGSAPYIFFSYCRDDAGEVFPIIEWLDEAGFRVWYDKGIHPGEAWPEMIAAHIDRCTVCVAAVTEAFSGSHNCRNEMNYCIGKNIPFIPLILSEFQMTSGFLLLLASCRSFRLSDFPDPESLIRKLSEEPSVTSCRGQRQELSQEETEADAVLWHPRRKQYYEARPVHTVIGRGNTCKVILTDRRVGTRHAIIEKRENGYMIRDEQSKNGTWVEDRRIPPLSWVPLYCGTHLKLAGESLVFLDGEAAQALKEAHICGMLTCRETGECLWIGRGPFLLGRANPWPGGTFRSLMASRSHGRLVLSGRSYFLESGEIQSTNGTYLNDTLLQKGDRLALTDGDTIRIGLNIYHILFHEITGIGRQ